MKFRELPNEDKPRERLVLYGANNLNNEEILMILLKSGTKKYSVKDLANKILKDTGGISNLKNMTYQNLMKIDGIGKVKSIELVAIVELARRIYMEKNIKDIVLCTNPETIIYYFNSLFKDKLQEEFYVIYLDNKKNYLDMKKLFIGSINASIVHPREIFKEAYLVSASFIICIHNHPTGDILPSNDDIILTNNLKEIGKINGISVIDHIIIGNNNYYSFYDNNDM
jgi:DNA repair protein RadC